MEDNQNMENMTDQNDSHGNDSQGNKIGKMFTQDEVNQIVQSRLARFKNESANNIDYSGREAALTKREMQLTAREALMDAGLPKEMIGAVNTNSKEEMENSINILKSFFGSNGKAKSTYRVVSGGVPSGGNAGGYDSDSAIRKAMGLTKGK